MICFYLSLSDLWLTQTLLIKFCLFLYNLKIILITMLILKNRVIQIAFQLHNFSIMDSFLFLILFFPHLLSKIILLLFDPSILKSLLPTTISLPSYAIIIKPFYFIILIFLNWSSSWFTACWLIYKHCYIINYD